MAHWFAQWSATSVLWAQSRWSKRTDIFFHLIKKALLCVALRQAVQVPSTCANAKKHASCQSKITLCTFLYLPSRNTWTSLSTGLTPTIKWCTEKIPQNANDESSNLFTLGFKKICSLLITEYSSPAGWVLNDGIFEWLKWTILLLSTAFFFIICFIWQGCLVNPVFSRDAKWSSLQSRRMNIPK